MKKLTKVQKTIFFLGVLGTGIGLFGKFNAWEHNDYFPLFYVGISFMWIAFLNTNKTCVNVFKKAS